MAGAGTDGTRQVDAYLEAVEGPQRGTLARLRSTLRSVLPRSHEAMKYGMPAVVLDGKGVAGYAAFKEHCGYFPMSSAVLDAAGPAVGAYPRSKGGLRFPVDRPLPVSLVRRLVRLRLDEISAVQHGPRTEYYDDGTVKAAGRMKDGELHGDWRWYRRDGSLSRTGRFRSGTRVGTWQTWDRDGHLVRTTELGS